MKAKTNREKKLPAIVTDKQSWAIKQEMEKIKKLIIATVGNNKNRQNVLFRLLSDYEMLCYREMCRRIDVVTLYAYMQEGNGKTRTLRFYKNMVRGTLTMKDKYKSERTEYTIDRAADTTDFTAYDIMERELRDAGITFNELEKIADETEREVQSGEPEF